ncbi:hypothetical protein LC605_15950 [Nostoc sp. CHAB 5836]|uniref:hypothetical protein n=1 Tax=Nostoc sp. CHAB 5836 TaxID=2780404 RepID=UPI001E391C29|nr:hypothetical protein [Nostoc sp. CHAB 5836]MCC5616538.1 hypothetical protein [Nostoc sp. CHAB 5836]
MKFKLRGVEYAIENSSDTILSKIAASMKNGMTQPEDDARVAYAVCTACPSLPSGIVSYKSPNEFVLSLDTLEISVFMIALNIAILEKTKNQSKSQSDKLAIDKKIKELKLMLRKLDDGFTSEQVSLILGQITVSDISTTNVDAYESISVDAVEIQDDLELDLDLEEDQQPLTPEEEAIARKLLKQQVASNRLS